MLAASALLTAVSGATAAAIIGTIALGHNPQNEFCTGGKTVVDDVTHWGDCTLTADYYTLVGSIFGMVAVPAFVLALAAGFLVRAVMRRWDAARPSS